MVRYGKIYAEMGNHHRIIEGEKMTRLFNPKQLLELNIDEYIIYISSVLKRIMFIFVILIVLAPSVFFYISYDLNHENSMFQNIISLCRLIFSAGILFTLAMLFTQSCLTRKHKQVSIDMEKSHKAVDLLYKWSCESNAEMFLARKIVDRMKDKEVKKLTVGNEKVTVSNEDYDMMRDFFPKNMVHENKSLNNNECLKENVCKEDNTCKNEIKCSHADKCEAAHSKELSMAQTIWLRAWIVRYLNLLEIIMYAWQSGVIDRSIIEKEFEYLVKTDRDGSVVLEKYRKFSGRENYPGIYSFCNYMEEKNRKKIEETKMEG